ncbi:MAG: type II toxin-antitoxin system RelE/ParE family toxin [Acidobacteria bacterium]|nr:type II toxin-antitoxin system RelE/ParE family toxin [Acidobacteriota bacterium]
MKITWSPLALERVNDIVDYIAQENLEAAERLAIELFGAVERLEKFPESGRVIPELSRSTIREIIYKKYRILYRIEAKQIAILTVRHVRQQFQSDELI